MAESAEKKPDLRKRGCIQLDKQLHSRFKSVLQKNNHGPMNSVVADFIRAYLQAPEQLRIAIYQILAGSDPFAPGATKMKPIKLPIKQGGVFGGISDKAAKLKN